VRGRSRLLAAVVGLAALALVGVLALSVGDRTEAEGSPLLGVVAPPLVGSTMNGGSFDIDQHRGQWVLVNFFATWCPPCVTEHPELVSFSERNPEVQLVSVAFDDTEVDKVERFFADNGGDWPVITAGAGGASLDYGVKKLPESFLVDPAGRVAVKINGGVTAAQLESHISAATSPPVDGGAGP
jgi:cytochrome c biogenesis protein CcmG, thiol:disulfide interchange protein DsbE